MDQFAGGPQITGRRNRDRQPPPGRRTGGGEEALGPTFPVAQKDDEKVRGYGPDHTGKDFRQVAARLDEFLKLAKDKATRASVAPFARQLLYDIASDTPLPPPQPGEVRSRPPTHPTELRVKAVQIFGLLGKELTGAHADQISRLLADPVKEVRDAARALPADQSKDDRRKPNPHARTGGLRFPGGSGGIP